MLDPMLPIRIRDPVPFLPWITHNFDSLMPNFWVKDIIILSVLAKTFFLPVKK